MAGRSPAPSSAPTATGGSSPSPAAGAPPPPQPIIATEPIVVVCRVRPMTDAETTSIPEGSVVPRGGIETGPNKVQLLDPLLKFKPKKNGNFAFDYVQSGFVEPTADPPEKSAAAAARVSAQMDFFMTVGLPMVGHLMDGFHTTLCVCGASRTGKTFSLFGDASGDDQGLIYRFFITLFDQITRRPANSKIEVDLDFVEIVGDTQINDLFKKKGAAAAGKVEEPIRVREEPDMVSWVGAQKVPIETPEAAQTAVRNALRGARKVKTSHLVMQVILTETLSFADPSNPTNVVSKTHHMKATFALVAGSPVPFFRCVDAASARAEAKGATTVKIPTRETTLTRILAEFFGGNSRSQLVACISPCCDHQKDTLVTLQMAAKLVGVRTNAKHVVDQSTLVFKRLEDTVKGLESQLSAAAEAREVVQSELDRRQARLEELARIQKEHKPALELGEDLERKEDMISQVKRLRQKMIIDRFVQQENTLEAEIDDCETSVAELRAANAELLTGMPQCEAEVVKVEAARTALAEERTQLDEIVANRDLRQRELAAMQSGEAGRMEFLNTIHAERMTALQSEQAKLVEQTATEDEALAAIQPTLRITKTAFDAVKKEEALIVELTQQTTTKDQEEKQLRDDIKALEEEIAGLEMELSKKEESTGCCSVQ